MDAKTALWSAFLALSPEHQVSIIIQLGGVLASAVASGVGLWVLVARHEIARARSATQGWKNKAESLEWELTRLTQRENGHDGSVEREVGHETSARGSA